MPYCQNDIEVKCEVPIHCNFGKILGGCVFVKFVKSHSNDAVFVFRLLFYVYFYFSLLFSPILFKDFLLTSPHLIRISAYIDHVWNKLDAGRHLYKLIIIVGSCILCLSAWTLLALHY